MNKIIVSFFLLLLTWALKAQTLNLKSPDDKLETKIRIDQEGIFYSVSYEKKPVLNWSKLTLIINDNYFQNNLTLSRPAYRDTTEKYDLIIGKASHVEARFKEMKISIKQKASPYTKINLVFRSFNEGIAFRYEFISSETTSLLLNEERDEFRFTEDSIAKVLPLPNFTSSHEGFYSTTSLQKINDGQLLDMPALFQLKNGINVAITEAALLDYAGMYLVKQKGILQSKLSPLPDKPSVAVIAKYPHQSPWRVIMVSRNVGDFISSTMLTTLCPPNRIKDVSWIKPGKTTFPWWNGNVTTDTLNAPGNNFITQKYFIDFCHRNKIQFHSVVEYGLHQWYVDDGIGFQPGPHSDVTQAVPGLDMKEVCDYAHAQGVDVRVWVQWAALYPKIDAAFAQFEKWGLSGMMIDFMDRDDQEMVNIQTEMLEKAAKHHLHVQFHGAYKPTGLSRTYPNEFTREGTLNYEVNKWSDGLKANHDLDIAFTRLIAGSTDYHLGGFRAVPDSLYRTQYTKPLMHGTRCHMLAMYVVLENALGMVCDYPEAYEGQPGFDFVQKVPTTWDETKVLEAKPDQYLVVARRKGNTWYIGSINNNAERVISIDLSFIKNKNLELESYEDAIDSRKYPNHIYQEKRKINAGDKIQLKLAAGGGAALIVREDN
jgi:alpha-glucosidase